VTFPQLPTSPADWAGAGWSDVEPFYAALMAAPLTEQSLDAWLAQWSALESLLTEAASRAMIAHTLDTASTEKEAAHLRFSTEVLPRAEEQSV
jgi:oligoendopeptidase F